MATYMCYMCFLSDSSKAQLEEMERVQGRGKLPAEGVASRAANGVYIFLFPRRCGCFQKCVINSEMPGTSKTSGSASAEGVCARCQATRSLMIHCACGKVSYCRSECRAQHARKHFKDCVHALPFISSSSVALKKSDGTDDEKEEDESEEEEREEEEEEEGEEEEEEGSEEEEGDSPGRQDTEKGRGLARGGNARAKNLRGRGRVKYTEVDAGSGSESGSESDKSDAKPRKKAADDDDDDSDDGFTRRKRGRKGGSGRRTMKRERGTKKKSTGKGKASRPAGGVPAWKQKRKDTPQRAGLPSIEEEQLSSPAAKVRGAAPPTPGLGSPLSQSNVSATFDDFFPSPGMKEDGEVDDDVGKALASSKYVGGAKRTARVSIESPIEQFSDDGDRLPTERRHLMKSALPGLGRRGPLHATLQLIPPSLDTTASAVTNISCVDLSRTSSSLNLSASESAASSSTAFSSAVQPKAVKASISTVAALRLSSVERPSSSALPEPPATSSCGSGKAGQLKTASAANVSSAAWHVPSVSLHSSLVAASSTTPPSPPTETARDSVSPADDPSTSSERRAASSAFLTCLRPRYEKSMKPVEESEETRVLGVLCKIESGVWKGGIELMRACGGDLFSAWSLYAYGTPIHHAFIRHYCALYLWINRVRLAADFAEEATNGQPPSSSRLGQIAISVAVNLDTMEGNQASLRALREIYKTRVHFHWLDLSGPIDKLPKPPAGVRSMRLFGVKEWYLSTYYIDVTERPMLFSFPPGTYEQNQMVLRAHRSPWLRD